MKKLLFSFVICCAFISHSERAHSAVWGASSVNYIAGPSVNAQCYTISTAWQDAVVFDTGIAIQCGITMYPFFAGFGCGWPGAYAGGLHCGSSYTYQPYEQINIGNAGGQFAAYASHYGMSTGAGWSWIMNSQAEKWCGIDSVTGVVVYCS